MCLNWPGDAVIRVLVQVRSIPKGIKGVAPLHDEPSSALSNIWSTWKDKREERPEEKEGKNPNQPKPKPSQAYPGDEVQSFKEHNIPLRNNQRSFTEPEGGFQLRTPPDMRREG